MSQIEVPDWVTKVAEDARVHCLNAVTAYGSAGVDERYHMAMRAAIQAAVEDMGIAELIEADMAFDAADSAWGGDRYERDDYGVYGSDFWRCLDCENESGAGVLNKGVTHEQGCRVAALERAIERRNAALARIGATK